MNIAAKLKSVRNKLGYSQEGMASTLNVPTRTLQNWEQGTRIPRGLAGQYLEKKLAELSKK